MGEQWRLALLGGLAGDSPPWRMQVRGDQKRHAYPKEKLVQRNGPREVISGNHGSRGMEGHQLEETGRGQIMKGLSTRLRHPGV